MRIPIGPVAVIIQLGAIVVTATLLPLIIGIWLDTQFHTAPWITLVALIVGIVGAMAGVVQVISALYRRT